MVVTEKAFQKFLNRIGEDFNILIPSRKKDGDNLSLEPYNPDHEWVIASYRPNDPLKTYFYPAFDQVLPLPTTSYPKRIIFGVKNCDLHALTILDRALLEDNNFTDLNYKKWREATYIVAADCTEISPVCHCNLVGVEPYPELNFDLSMSYTSAGYHLEAKTAKGEEIIGLLKKYTTLHDSPGTVQAEIDQNRAQIKELLKKQNQQYSSYTFDREITNNLGTNNWPNFAKACVECGGCCYICPTCYCILIKDVTKLTEKREFQKVKTWDSCQHTGYAKVAGGGSPRPNLWQRFRHRYQCKFSAMVENFSKTGCTGCGRCITVCPATIDIRETVVKSHGEQ
jgi:formate hydrogenlyase subunit 6/NADH:ubiquinone oxidoreductase subunit I